MSECRYLLERYATVILDSSCEMYTLLPKEPEGPAVLF